MILIVGVATVLGATLYPSLAVALAVAAAVLAVSALLLFLMVAAREIRDAHDLVYQAQRAAAAAEAAAAAWPPAQSPAATLFTDTSSTDGDLPDLADLRIGAAPSAPHSAAHPGQQSVATTRGLLDSFPGRAQVFAKHARRLQVLLNFCLGRLDRLEKEHEDPDLLNGLFEVDHAVVQARRQAANLAILAGELPQHRSTSPVHVYTVLRTTLQEIQRYTQAVIVPTPPVSLHGAGVVEVIHLLAELLDNATQVCDPQGDPVTVSARLLSNGSLCIKIADNGLGLPEDDIDRLNRVLDGSDPHEAELLLKDHRTGLVVAAELARRNGIRVALEKNVYEGVTAAVILPATMLQVDHPRVESGRRSRQAALTAPSSAPTSEPNPAPAPPATTWRTPEQPGAAQGGGSNRPGSGQPRSQGPDPSVDTPVPVGAVPTFTASRPTATGHGPADQPRHPAAVQPQPHRTGPGRGGTLDFTAEQSGAHHLPVRHETPHEPPNGHGPLADLPVRARRSGTEERGNDDRPPLPVRSRTSSTMPAELRTAPTGPPIAPGYSGNLLAGIQDIREQRTDAPPSTDNPHTPQRTDSTWPTTSA